MRFISNDRRSTFLALIAADLVAAVLFALFTYSTEQSADNDIGYLFVLLLVGIAYSFIAIIVFVLPLLIVFGRLRAINLPLTLVAGFVIGMVIASTTEWPANGLTELIQFNFGDHAARRIWAFAAIGCASALGFWLVRKRNSVAPEG